MIMRNRGDPTCSSNYRFDLSQLPPEAISRLNQIMPDMSGNNLWAHEWNKHGSCYLKYLSSKVLGPYAYTTPAFAKQAFLKYFQAISDLYARIASRFRLQKSLYGNELELARDLNLSPDAFKVQMVRDE